MNTFVPKDYWENRLKKKFGLHGVGYLGLGKHYNNWLYKIKKAVFFRKLKSHRLDFANCNVLDVGCGTGFYIERWKDLGVRKIVAIDITNVAIENLRPKYPDVGFYQMDIGANVQSIPSFRFDAVSAFDVLYHIVDDKKYEKAMGNIYSLLKAGGLFIWSDNFLHDKTERSTHQVSRSLDSIEKLLIATGFQIIERRPMFYLMNAPIDTSNRLKKIFWRIVGLSVSRSEFAGLVIGALLYPLELMLTSLAKESPTTEIMICKKP
jgi:2-polyprenyl-3-methyl-5-hydroxy-6-metoxy-1,4-benzoquinol methylase